jgi:hypothetical protein
MSACWKGHTAIAELLIAKGADMEAKDKVRHMIGVESGYVMFNFGLVQRQESVDVGMSEGAHGHC